MFVTLKEDFAVLISGKSLSGFSFGLWGKITVQYSLWVAGDGICKGPVETAHRCKWCEGGTISEAAVMGSGLHGIYPMLFFAFTFFIHELSNSAVLYTVTAGE